MRGGLSGNGVLHPAEYLLISVGYLVVVPVGMAVLGEWGVAFYVILSWLAGAMAVRNYGDRDE